MANKQFEEGLGENKLVKQVYDDALHPALSTLGKAVDGVMRFVALPFTFLGMSADELSKRYKDFISETAHTVPADKLTIPKAAIIAPLLENLKYVFEEDELKTYYSNLLACSMNSDITSLMHPAYVEVLKQMSPLDARLFRDMFLCRDEVLLERFQWQYDRSLLFLGIDSFSRLGLVTEQVKNETLETKICLTNFGCIFKNICLEDNKELSDIELKNLVKERNSLYSFDTEGEILSFGMRVVNTVAEYDMFHYQGDLKHIKSMLPALILTIVNNERADVNIDDLFIETEIKLDLLHKTKQKIQCDNNRFPCKIAALEFKTFIFPGIDENCVILKNKKSRLKVITGAVSYDLSIRDAV